MHFLSSSHFNKKWKQDQTTKVFWVLIMRPWHPLLSWIASFNPGSWVLPSSHFTDDNSKVLRDEATCPSSQRRCIVEGQCLPSSWALNHCAVWPCVRVCLGGVSHSQCRSQGARWWVLLFRGDRRQFVLGRVNRLWSGKGSGKGVWGGLGRPRWASWVSSQPLFLTADRVSQNQASHTNTA